MSRKLQVLLTIGLLLMLTQTAVLADGPEDPPPIEIEEDWVGWVASEQLRSALPVSKSGRGLAPNSTHPVPGGGYAWAQAYLGWAPLRMDAIAKTGLSSEVTGEYLCSAKVTQVYKDGVPKGASAPKSKWLSGGGEVSAKKSVYEWVYGHTWRNDTEHIVTGNGFDWRPTNSVSVTL